VSDRANLLDTTDVVEQAALDKYTFVRDAWLQRRRNLVYDGNPPPEKERPEKERSGSSQPFLAASAEPAIAQAAPSEDPEAAEPGARPMLIGASSEAVSPPTAPQSVPPSTLQSTN
jgi:phospholipid-binding lipoprotein MlaA